MIRWGPEAAAWASRGLTMTKRPSSGWTSYLGTSFRALVPIVERRRAFAEQCLVVEIGA